MNGRGSNHPTGGIVDLGALAHPQSKDEHLAGIVTLAQANPEAFQHVRDTEDIEDAFVQGYSLALASFVGITTGGMVTVPEDVLMRCALLAYVDQRGMLWTSALASTQPPIEEGQLEFDPDLVVAYLTARKANEVAEQMLNQVRDKVSAILHRKAEDEAAKVSLMTTGRIR